MKLHHIAIWTFRLEELKDFYVRFLGGTSNEKYINPKKGFEPYFISFDEGPTLELMSRADVQNTPMGVFCTSVRLISSRSAPQSKRIK